MADETAQIALATEQTPFAAPAETTSLPGDAAAAVPGDDGTASAIDLSTPEAVRAASEKFPAIRDLLEKHRLDGENTARQRLQNDLRRDQGSLDRAKAYQELLANKYGIDLDAEDARALPTFVRANADYVRSELGRQWVAASLSNFGEQEASVIQGIVDSIDGDPDKLTDVAGKTWEAAAAKIKSTAVRDLKVADVPADSSLHADIQRLIDAGVAAEVKARNMEANKTDQAPRANGVAPGAGGLTADNARNMSATDAAKLSDEDYDRWRRLIASTAGAA